MLQNPCKTLGFKKIMVYKIPPGGGGVNHIQPVAYLSKLSNHWDVQQPILMQEALLIISPAGHGQLVKNAHTCNS